ncbi:MAG: hypothetical protein ABH824_03090 [Nanoarchaeota archaeon]|nr:hypothetical protein [Nanoarchaeota archaeon]MBU1632311.1 hypothetical protein [Nanoarchaeota archaeon]MBU1875801.1 hypothetical protein [Nanoarchaeota archaeon]
MVFDAVAGTVQEFIDYALTIVSLMIIYYVVKFFVVAPPSDEEKRRQEQEREEKGARLRGWLGEKHTKMKEDQIAREEVLKKQREQQHREDRIRYPKSSLVEAVGNCEDLSRYLDRKDFSSAESQLRRLQKNLHLATHYLRAIRKKEKGKLYEMFDKLYGYGGVALSKADKIKLPASNDPEIEDKFNSIKTELSGNKGIKEICGLIIKALDDFVEHAKAEVAKDVVEERTQQEAQRQTERQVQRRGRSGGPQAVVRPGSSRR